MTKTIKGVKGIFGDDLPAIELDETDVQKNIREKPQYFSDAEKQRAFGNDWKRILGGK